ncbi:MAG: hypothetical protein CMF59_19520 [Leptospiraceae bacterium]|nr:hypothetical protein [Leptospiraceae bacterium]MBI41791.1 hypothetical protein [Leptospiraceae bacterium]
MCFSKRFSVEPRFASFGRTASQSSRAAPYFSLACFLQCSSKPDFVDTPGSISYRATEVADPQVARFGVDHLTERAHPGAMGQRSENEPAIEQELAAQRTMSRWHQEGLWLDY